MSDNLIMQTEGKQNEQTQNTKTTQFQPNQNSVWDNKKRIGIIAGILIAIILLIYLIASNSGTKVDLAQLYSIEIYGLNGYATATVTFKSDAYSTTDYSNFDSLYQDWMKDDFLSGIQFDLSETENIANGDKIIAVANFDKNSAKKLGFNLKNTKLTVKVDGLKDGEIVDVFDGLEVKFDGISPYGTVTFNNNNSNEFIRNVTYLSESTSNLQNNDEITITASYSASLAVEHSVIVDQNKKAYTVSGLPEYITDSSILSNNQQDIINNESSDALEALLSESWKRIYSSFSDSSSYNLHKESTSSKAISQTLLTLKKSDGSSYSEYTTYNSIVTIYEVTIETSSTSKYSEGGTATGYIAIILDNASIDQDEKVSFKSTSWTGSYDWEKSIHLETIKDSVITSKKAAYILTEWK